MKFLYKIIFIYCLAVYLNACASPTSPDFTAIQVVPEQLVSCVEPRPKICTREYKPVCAIEEAGTSCLTAPCATIEKKTYATGCTACANPNIRAYTSGKCDS